MIMMLLKMTMLAGMPTRHTGTDRTGNLVDALQQLSKNPLENHHFQKLDQLRDMMFLNPTLEMSS